MALTYVPVDRDQQFLLPPDLRQWLPPGHLVWFVLDVVERVDTSALHARHPNDGVGRRAYDPDMLLALLIYAYCTGVRSSRQIERLCEVDVAFRVICANLVPDHTTIARFRQGHQHQAVRLFTDVLVLCAAAGLASVGVVAVDGTKMGANAARAANRNREQLEAEVAAMFADAELTDTAEERLFGEGRGDELPEGLADPRSRRQRLDAALRELQRMEEARGAEREEARRARAAAEADAARRGEGVKGRPPRDRQVARAEAALERKRAQAAAHRADVEARAAAEGRKPKGPPPRDGPRVARAQERLRRAKDEAARRASEPSRDDSAQAVNVTDPESRMMKSPHGWVQGYNAQAAVNTHGVVLAAEAPTTPTTSASVSP